MCSEGGTPRSRISCGGSMFDLFEMQQHVCPCQQEDLHPHRRNASCSTVVNLMATEEHPTATGRCSAVAQCSVHAGQRLPPSPPAAPAPFRATAPPCSRPAAGLRMWHTLKQHAGQQPQPFSANSSVWAAAVVPTDQLPPATPAASKSNPARAHPALAATAAGTPAAQPALTLMSCA